LKLSVLTGSLSRNAGGTFTSIRRPTQIINQNYNITCNVLGLKDEYSEIDLLKWSPLNTKLHNTVGPKSFGYSTNYKKTLKNIETDLIHIRGIWMYYSYVNYKQSIKSKIPYIISPHGMLDPWAVKNSHWKKKIAGWLFENKHLSNASCIHALNESEAKAIRQYGLKNPICIIPNGIDIDEQYGDINSSWLKEIPKGKKILLFLGRIHPKKGLLNLLNAFELLRTKRNDLANDWILAIAGWDQLGHKVELEKIVQDKKLTNYIKFIGPQFDENKRSTFQGVDAFILPSYSEGLPMTVLEAWANKLPVLMTPECNLQEGFQKNAAIKIMTHPKSMYQGLLQLFSISGSERMQMGLNGYELVKRKFTWEQIASEMYQVYEWILKGASQPDSVRFYNHD